MSYIIDNMVKPHDKFTADKDEDSIRELFDRLEEIHLAPEVQASYKVKIEAVFKCLDGSAKQSVMGWKGAATRSEYLELWRDLFKRFGNKANDVARHIRRINAAAPKSTDPKEVMTYMNELKNAAVQLRRLEHPKDQIASMVWNSLREILPDYVYDYCRLKVKRFDEDFGSDVATWHSLDGLSKFDAFYAYVLSNTITKASLKTERTIHCSQLADKDPQDPGEKSVMQVVTGDSNQQSEDEGPPAKKQKLDQASDNEKKEKGIAKNRNLGQKKVCLLCRDAGHIWQNCLMHIDGRLEIFRRDGLCTKCAKKNHSASECTSQVQCPTCEDPKDPTKGAHHHAVCYIMHGFPTRGRGARGKPHRGGNGNGRGRGQGGGNQEHSVG
jgi:hypothetical protein